MHIQTWDFPLKVTATFSVPNTYVCIKSKNKADILIIVARKTRN